MLPRNGVLLLLLNETSRGILIMEDLKGKLEAYTQQLEQVITHDLYVRIWSRVLLIFFLILEVSRRTVTHRKR